MHSRFPREGTSSKAESGARLEEELEGMQRMWVLLAGAPFGEENSEDLCLSVSPCAFSCHPRGVSSNRCLWAEGTCVEWSSGWVSERRNHFSCVSEPSPFFGHSLVC